MSADSRLILALPAVLLAACMPDQRVGENPTADRDSDTFQAAERDAERLGRDDTADIRREPGVIPDDRPVAGPDVFEPNDDPADSAEKLADAEEQIFEAVDVVGTMKSDPELAALLDEARGVFIVPDYAQAGLVVGGQGGEGVVMLRNDDPAAGGEWSAPAFFNISGVTAGASAGVEAGSIALLLMSDEAALPFRNDDNNFSLVANANLTIVDFSTRAEGDADMGDIIVWTDTEGAFAGATVGVRGINRDDDEIEAFYGPGANAREVLSGNRENPRAQMLQDALSG